MSVVERDLYHLGSRLDEHLVASKESHDHIAQLVEKLDAKDDVLDLRIDAIDKRLAYIGGAVALAVFAGQILGPLILRALGVPS